MTLNLIRRLVKGTPLTATDHDGNLDKLEDAIEARPTTAEQGTAITAAVSAHVAAADPHPGYLTPAEGDEAYVGLGDARLTDARTPTAHKSTHAAGGSDALTPGDIGADPAGTAAAAVAALISQLRNGRTIYVSLEGDDLNDGTSEAESLRTLRAASLAAEPGDVVFVAPGLYIETILPIRWKHDVTMFGSGLRSTIVQPFPGQEFNDVFKVDSGFWCWGVSFAGHQADETRQAWAITFDELADNTGRGAIGLGAFILKSPYIQNCTSITAEDDAGLAGSQSTGNTGGGIRVDGSQCAINSPIRSMVVDSYTQVNLGGPGCLVLNDGYAQLVSFFGTFCTYHVRTETGGQVNLSGGGTTDFGIYGLMADGYSRSPMFTGGARVAAYGAVRLQKTVTIDVDTDLFGCTAHGLSAGDQLVINATQGELPTGISANTVYFVLASGLTADAFKLSTTPAGSSLDMSGSASGTYEFVRQGVTQLDVVGFSANRLGRQIKYPSAGSLGSPGNPVQITARGGSTPGSTFTVTLGTSTIGHEYVGGGVVTVGGTDYPITSATYDGATGVTVLTATGYAPTVDASVTLAGLSFICDSASRPNAGQIMFPQLVFPRDASTEVPEAKTFAYTKTGDFTLTYTEAASPAGPEHEYVSGGTVVIGGTDYGVTNAAYNKTTGLVTLTTELQLPAGDGNVTVDGLRFICPTSGYVVTSSVPINASGVEVANTDPTRAGYRVVFFSGTNGGLKDPISQGQVLDFRNRSQITAPGHTFEFVGSGTNYDALPQNGGIPVQANAIVETNNGKVYSSNTNEKGDFRVGDQFAVDGTTGAVTINSDQFNLSGLNFIGPFSRNGGISTVGEQLRELSNNTSLIASTGTPDGNTAPTQFAVKTYADNRFLQDVTVTAGTPLILTDTSTQDGQGFWTRRRNLSISATPTFEGLTITGTEPVVIPHIHGSIAGDFYIHVRNTSGGPLEAGTAVCAVGSVGDTDRIEVIACDPTDPAKMPAIGLLQTTLANNGDHGDAVVLGELRPFNTGGYQIRDRLYVGAGGALVASPPASGLVQYVGSVARAQAETGTILVGIGAAMARVGFTGAYADLAGAPELVSTTTAGLQPATSFSTITYGASVALDFAALDSQYRTISLTGNLELTTSNLANGRSLVLRLVADATERTLTFPIDWKFVGTKPATIAASKTAVLSLTAFGAANTDIVAAYAVQS